MQTKRECIRRLGILGFLLLAVSGCGRNEEPAKPSAPASSGGHERMIDLLQEVAARTNDEHYWIGDKDVRDLRKMLAALPPDATLADRLMAHGRLGMREGWLGEFDAAIEQLNAAHSLLPQIGNRLPPRLRYELLLGTGLVWLRVGEVANCVRRCSSDSCLMPIQGKGIHVDQQGSRRAIEYFTEMAERFPSRYTPRWLLNIAYMTVGGYPDQVPKKYRISPGLFRFEADFPRFTNIAIEAGLDTFSLCGSVIVEDFDNDHLLDLFVSSWDPRVEVRLFRNKGDGSFEDRAEQAGLKGIVGGANLIQADYDNDGFTDVLILRGTWLSRYGRHPNSLLRNNGDGTFTDVTFDAGLAEAHYPTESAGWADYDRDGDLDLYISNESDEGNDAGDGLRAPSQLFRNNGDGTFTDVARQAGVQNYRCGHGCSWGDYDGDGFPDLYVSNLNREPNRLYHNNGDGTFTDVAPKLGVTRPHCSYSAWFWDFDNDGNLDLYVPSYQGGVEAVAASYFGAPLPPGTELPCLYKGDGKGGFQDVAMFRKLTRPVMSMGANFGDLANDGYLDFYLGTGYPEYDAVMPNVMYRNLGGKGFADVTFAGNFGHLQKGHGIAFVDLDHDGDQDVFEQLGGAFRGDGAADALYENPGFGNNWIKLKLVGVRSNRSAIGARIRLDIDDDGTRRSIFRYVNSGGSFGANPLRREIGVGKARVIDLMQITWPATGQTQTFEKVEVGRFLEITEGKDEPRVLPLKTFRFGTR